MLCIISDRYVFRGTGKSVGRVPDSNTQQDHISVLYNTTINNEYNIHAAVNNGITQQ